MKVFYFERKEESEIHIHAGSYAKGVYIPDEKVILVKEFHGTFGEGDYTVIDKPEILDEINQAINGTFQKNNVSYKRIKGFKLKNEKIIKELIQDAQSERELRKKVTSGIEGLLKKCSGE